MENTAVIVFVLLGLAKIGCEAQKDGFISISDSSKVKVGLTCAPKYMVVALKFNQTFTSAFYDWIVVGTNNVKKCRLKGDGQTKYIVELPLMDDPCGTRMTFRDTFENVIRVGQNPLIILKGDERITIRCVYGPPEVGTPIIPSVPTTSGLLLTTASPVPKEVKRAGLSVGYIYLIVFLILFLALLFLLCGCLYFFFKRRKVKLERRKKLILAVPPGSELNKLGLGHLWWSGKSSVSNDALLSHDYMISSNSTREGLSVSTDYAGDTPSTSSGSPGNQGPAANYANQHIFAQNQRGRAQQVPLTVHSLHSIPENFRGSGGLDETMRSQSITTVQPKCYGSGAIYAHLDTQNQAQSHKILHRNVDLDSVQISSKENPGIYAAPAKGDRSEQQQEDSGSVSTLEGTSSETQQSTQLKGAAKQATVTADVHAAAVLRQASAADIEREWTEEFVRAVEQNRGIGPRKLNEQEVSRWRHLVENDANVQEMLRRSRTLEEFQAISRHPQYQNLFPGEKWSVITQSLAHVTFMHRLNRIIDTQGQSHDTSTDGPDNTTLPSGKRRYLKKSDGATPRQVVNTTATSTSTSEMEETTRVFTRDSFYRMKEETESVIDDDKTTDVDYTSDRATTEFMEGAPTVCIRGSPPPPPIRTTSAVSSNTYERPPTDNADTAPTLSVYVGNMEERALPHHVRDKHIGRGQSTLLQSASTTYGTSSYANWQSNPEEL